MQGMYLRSTFSTTTVIITVVFCRNEIQQATILSSRYYACQLEIFLEEILEKCKKLKKELP